MAELPSGTATFLSTDIEGSTTRWEQQSQAMRRAVARHGPLIRQAVGQPGGSVFRSTGDGLCAAFATASEAVAAAVAAQRALHAEPWGQAGRLRMHLAFHTSAADVHDGDDVGASLNRLARLLAAAHGGQGLLSHVTAGLAQAACWQGPACVTWASTGCATWSRRPRSLRCSTPTCRLTSRPGVRCRPSGQPGAACQ